MADIEETAIILEQAGIAEHESYTKALSDMANKSADAVETFGGIREIRDSEGYREAKKALTNLRAVKREAEEKRKRITKELDKAKKAATGMMNDATAMLDEEIAATETAKKQAEERWRSAKRRRLGRYWEETFPVLALSIESADPFVPFERVFDPDWVKRISEVNNDKPAQEKMHELADTIAEGQKTIDNEDKPDVWKQSALRELFRTFDLSAAIRTATETVRQNEALETARTAQAAVNEEPAKVGLERCQSPAETVSYSIEIYPQTVAIDHTEIACESEEELHIMRKLVMQLGIHGRTKRTRSQQ